MDLSPLQFTVTSTDRDILKELASMTGREVRVRVIRGGQEGDSVLLRWSGSLLRAKISGTSVREGDSLFLKILRESGGGFRLQIVRRDASSVPPQAASFAKGLNPTSGLPPLPGWILPWVEAYLKGEKRGDARGELAVVRKDAHGKETEVAGKVASGERQAKGAILERALELLPPEAKELRRIMERLVEWEVPVEALFWSDPSTELARDDKGFLHVLGLEGGGASMRSFVVLTQFPILGRISLLFLSSTPDFERIHIRMGVANSSTAELVRPLLDDWRQEARQQGISLESLDLLPLPGHIRSPGIDLQA